jgi:hypothetical protein
MFLDKDVKINTYDVVVAYTLIQKYVATIHNDCSSEQLHEYEKLLIRLELKVKRAQARALYNHDKTNYHKKMSDIAELEKQLKN